jgi:hypothetical protein
MVVLTFHYFATMPAGSLTVALEKNGQATSNLNNFPG